MHAPHRDYIIRAKKEREIYTSLRTDIQNKKFVSPGHFCHDVHSQN